MAQETRWENPMARSTASARTKAAAVAVARKVENAAETRASVYRHAGKTMSGRPDVGAAPRFRAKAPPATYRYTEPRSRAGLGHQSGA